MRERKAARGFGGADLDRQHGLAVVVGAARGGKKAGRVGHAFDVAEDHFQFRLNRKIVDEIADLAADLAAAGGKVRDLEPKLVDGSVERSADRATLRCNRDGAFSELLQSLVRDAA